MAMEINQKMPIRNLDRILSLTGKRAEELRVVMMGVAYRSEVDDTRYSASENFYRQAKKVGMKVTIHDPHVKYWREFSIHIDNSLPAADAFDLVVFCVPHAFYRALNMSEWLKDASPWVYDCDNVLTCEQLNELRNLGLTVQSTGRG